jgi:hypothetical protein
MTHSYQHATVSDYPDSLGRTVKERAFVIMQIGADDSPERRRADEIFDYLIRPTVEEFELEAYRADLDLYPGQITSKLLKELLEARLIIADLTGRNPNVFYELGIAHSYARPLISIADAPESLPFDAKDERIIKLGKFPDSGLPVKQQKSAEETLRKSLEIVLAEDYTPPSPLRGAATTRELNQLASEDPQAFEITQIREMLDEIRTSMIAHAISPGRVQDDITALHIVIEANIENLSDSDFEVLADSDTSTAHRKWVESIRSARTGRHQRTLRFTLDGNGMVTIQAPK